MLHCFTTITHLGCFPNTYVQKDMLAFKEVIPFSFQKRRGKGVVVGAEPSTPCCQGFAGPGLWEFTGSLVTFPFNQLQVSSIHSCLKAVRKKALALEPFVTRKKASAENMLFTSCSFQIRFWFGLTACSPPLTCYIISQQTFKVLPS